MKHKAYFFIATFAALALVVVAGVVIAQERQPGVALAPQTALGAAFTYQGQLKSSGNMYSGTCDFEFELYDAASAGAQIGATFTASSVSVAEGYFTTQLDFGGNAFDGNARWLAIGVRCPAGSGSYADLLPRQPLTAAPYALTALKTAYANVLVVAKSGGHYATISDALASITDNSAANRYLVWVAPGTYTETVTMKEYVDIEGAGELTTKITQVGSASTTTGTVVGANNAELRSLTVENTGGNLNATAIFNSSASPRLTQVTARALGGTTNSYGVFNISASSPLMTNMTVSALGATSLNIGVLNDTSSSTMMNVTVSASGGSISFGVYNDTSSPTMTNVTVNASGGTSNYGVYNDASSPTIQNSTIRSASGTSNYGIANTNTGTVKVNNSQIMGSTNTVMSAVGINTRIGASKLEGGAVLPNGGTVTCAGVYDEAYTFYTNTCP
jgi:hypothetical protein